MIELANFLSGYKLTNISSKSETTHVILHSALAGKYKIPYNAIKDFYHLYASAIDENEKLSVCEVEKMDNSGPLFFDIDYSLYTFDDIQKFVLELKDIFLKIKKTKTDTFDIIVLEKDKPEYNGSQDKWKDGIHFMLIYPLLKEERKNIYDEIFNYCSHNLIFSGAFFDNPMSTSAGQFVTMFGSFKPNKQPYKATYILRCPNNDKEIKMVELSTLELVKMTSMYQYTLHST
jgi:hypothetical protein